MGSAPAWRPSAAAGYWPTVGPRAASAYRPESGSSLATPGRLTRRSEFLRAAAKGCKAPMPGLVLQALPRDDQGPARLGFTVTRKIGNAVIRNRTRRRLKEAARLVLAEHPVSGVDLVLVGRATTRGRDFSALQDDLRRALAKAGVA
jgi:ribonuclease P protein component